MKSDKNEKITRLVLILAAYAVFVSLFITAITGAFNTDPIRFLQLLS